MQYFKIWLVTQVLFVSKTVVSGDTSSDHAFPVSWLANFEYWFDGIGRIIEFKLP